MTIPTSKTIARFIKETSPKGAKCIDADFIQIQKLSIIAWVIEKEISKNQGYYQAFYATCQNGKFDIPVASIPCRYYAEENKRQITSSSFCTNPESVSLISAKKDRDYTDVYITLVCSGKAMSRLYLRAEENERHPARTN